MSGARPIKMPYTRDLAALAGFFDSTYIYRRILAAEGIESLALN
jgi:hypothetical protein